MAVLLSAMASPCAWTQLLTREENTSLNLPAELPRGSFRTTDRFPGTTFSRPVALVTPPRETHRLFVVEQGGRIKVIPNLAEPEPEVFLDIRDRTRFDGESGLLGLAFHPQYSKNGWFYVFYTTLDERRQRVARFEVSPDNPDRALPDSEMPMIDQVDEASNHNGGDLHFGPDGYLYIALGDEGGANDRYDNARFIDKDFFAAIARIDVNQRPGSLPPNEHPAVHPNTYAIPPDNPFVDATEFMGESVDPAKVRTEFWAVGLRNPWRMSFDGPSGRLFTGDVGQGSREEINLIQRGGHYGWSLREGFRSFTSGPGRSIVPDGFTPTEPLWDYPRNQGISVTGGVVYRGRAYPELFEAYIFGDYGSGRIWSMHFREDDTVDVEQIATDARISAFGIDPQNGDVLMTSYGNGQIRKIERKSSGFTFVIPSALSLTGAFSDLETLTPEPGIVAYDPNVAFWSDGAFKKRWFSLPDLEMQIGFRETTPWRFPPGALWIKHFDLELQPGDPSSRRRVETRFLVKTEDGSYGLSYRWNEQQTDAALVPVEGMKEEFVIGEGDDTRIQTWLYPSRNDCRACHTAAGGHALSFNTAQLNRVHDYGESGSGNQLEAFREAGYLVDPPTELEGLPRLSAGDDESASLERRARSYLEANCSQCHQPGGPALGFWDARSHVPLTEAGLINGQVLNDLGNAAGRAIVPGDTTHSVLLSRLLGEKDTPRMPPLGTTEIDEQGAQLIRDWIVSLRDHVSYQDWIAQYFPAPIPADADPTVDFDGDGRTNFEEYLADTNPVRARDFWAPGIDVDGNKPFLLLPEIPRGNVTIERSESAFEWRLWMPRPEDITSLPNSGNTIIRIDGDNRPRGFFRFKLGE